MPFDVICSGLLAGAFASAAKTGPSAIICASGVPDSQCTDESAFWRERALLHDLTGRARDLLDVDDLVATVAAVLHRGVDNGIVNVAPGVSSPVLQLIEVITAVLRVSPSVMMADRGDRQEFSTAKVRDLLADYPLFSADYPDNVLRRRVPAIARACWAASASR